MASTCAFAATRLRGVDLQDALALLESLAHASQGHERGRAVRAQSQMRGLHQRDVAALERVDGALVRRLRLGALAVPVRLVASLAQLIRLHHGARLPRGFVLRGVLLLAPRALLGDAPLHLTHLLPRGVRLSLHALARRLRGGERFPRRAHGFLRRHELQFQLDVLQLGTPEAHLELGVHPATRLGLFFFHHGARVAAVVQIETLAVRILPATLPRLALFV
jgi:hypothetical protein